MKELLQATVDLAANSPPESVDQLAGLVRAGAPHSELRNWAINPGLRARVERLLTVWKPDSVTAAELAGLLIGASIAYGAAMAVERVELVWTGPASVEVSTRKTAQALLQVIDAARKKLFITSFVAYEVPSILDALRRALARNVRVSMLLELSEHHGGALSVDSIGKMKTALPAAHILTWRQKADAFAGGKVHAKCAVADEHICFISSANLTSHAMEKNMEAGILIVGGPVALNLHRHLDALRTTGVIEKV
jgi:cardiolipin synthase